MMSIQTLFFRLPFPLQYKGSETESAGKEEKNNFNT